MYAEMAAAWLIDAKDALVSWNLRMTFQQTSAPIIWTQMEGFAFHHFLVFQLTDFRVEQHVPYKKTLLENQHEKRKTTISKSHVSNGSVIQ